MGHNKYKFWFLVLLVLTIAGVFLFIFHELQFYKSCPDCPQFSILKFEFPHGKENLNVLIREWKELLCQQFIIEQLWIDYFFMFSLFPLIMVCCLWSGNVLDRHNMRMPIFEPGIWRKILVGIGMLQMLALSFDICENVRLEKWMIDGEVGNYLLYEEMVYMKFGIAVVGALFSIFSGVFIIVQKISNLLK